MSENELADYPGLYPRDGIWYVRKRVPIDLRNVFTSDIRKSLDVSDKRSAVRLYASKMAEVVQEYEAKRAELARLDKITQSLLTARLERLSLAEIDALVWDWWEKRVQFRHPEVDEFELPEVLSDIESDIKDVLAPGANDGDPAEQMADQLLVRAGMAAEHRKVGKITTAVKSPKVDRSTAQYSHLCDRVRRALEIEAKLARDHLTGGRSAPADPMFNPSSGVPTLSGVVSPQKTVGDLIDAYRAQRASIHGEESTRRKVGLLFRVVDEVVGRDTLASTLRREHCDEVHNFLKALPKNASKHFPNLSLTEARERGTERGLQGLSQNTVANYMEHLFAILNWAEDGGWGVAVNTKRFKLPREAQVQRRGFRPPELRLVFENLLAYRAEQPTRFWVPALALYTGARASEICQLRAEDIVQVGAVWCLNLTVFDDEGLRVSDKSLKTKSSERYVPLHTELMATGILKLLERRRRGDRVFSDLKPGPDGKYFHSMSKWFGRFLDGVGLPQKSLVFHSFRHGFRDACRAADISQETAEALGGWASEGQATRYGNRASVPVLVRAIEKVGYDDFALSKL